MTAALGPLMPWTQGSAATSESSATYINPYSGSPTNAYDSATAPGSTYSTTIYNVTTPTFTWNDSTAAAGYFDGTTWDINDNTKYNWNNGIFADYYTDNINVVFNDNNNGNYAVTLNTTVNPASVVFNNSSGNYTISGTGSIGGTGSLTKSGIGTVTLSTANTYSGGTNVSAGLLLIEPTSSTTSALPKGALSISGGEVQLAPNVTQGQPVGECSRHRTDQQCEHHVAVDHRHRYAGHRQQPHHHRLQRRADPIASIAAWIASGAYAGGTTITWTGTGITSSAAATQFRQLMASVMRIQPIRAIRRGWSDHGQIEIMYTLLGDANLDGKVNGTDFNLMATNFNQAVTPAGTRAISITTAKSTAATSCCWRTTSINSPANPRFRRPIWRPWMPSPPPTASTSRVFRNRGAPHWRRSRRSGFCNAARVRGEDRRNSAGRTRTYLLRIGLALRPRWKTIKFRHLR